MAAITNTFNIRLVPNPDTSELTPERKKDYHRLSAGALRFLSTSEGVFRYGQLLDKLPKWINCVLGAFGSAKISVLDTLSKNGSTAWTWCTTLPRIPSVLIDAKHSLQEMRVAAKDPSLTAAQQSYSIRKAFRDTTEAIAMSCHGIGQFIGLFPQTESLQQAISVTADTATLGHDTANAAMSVQVLRYAYAADTTGATEEITATLAQTKTNNWISLAKDICAIAAGVFGLFFVATGMAVVPGLVVLTLSLASTILGITRKLHEEQMDFKPINFLNPQHVQFA